ncbi:hypothetical protein PAMC26577_14200 [Caballeronia sordidicola]|uniref:Uncharacterized protein n=1 Tax=Caballeronia sordidicola TaxID=196367 RepID=A0A242MUA3_CABSO|nr:hypothetical protein PAMC26577_14200 [Caballeronia sordidicola]
MGLAPARCSHFYFAGIDRMLICANAPHRVLLWIGTKESTL